MFYRISGLVVRSPLSLRRAGPEEREVVLASRSSFPPAHPSTRGVIELMAGVEFPGARVLDLGCGSGVLGLCALALGAAWVVGCDIFLKPLRETAKNLRANPSLGPFYLFKGSTEALNARFDVILANLPLPVQAQKVKEYPRLLAPSGRLIVAGFYDVERPGLEADLGAGGFRILHRTFMEDSAQALADGGSSTWAALSAILGGA